LAQAGAISGTVTDAATGAPVGAALVTLQTGQTTFTSESGSDGRFTAPSLPPGMYTIVTLTGSRMTSSTTATVVAGATTQVALTVAALGQVSGTVTDTASGMPVPKVIVYAANDQGFVTSTLTDDHGAYVLGGFDVGTY